MFKIMLLFNNKQQCNENENDNENDNVNDNDSKKYLSF